VRDFLKTIGGGAKTSRSLTRDEARQAMALIADGECAPEQLGAFLMALRMKGETADELAGFVEALEARMSRMDAPSGTLDVDAHGDGHEGRPPLLEAAACAAAALGVPIVLRSELDSPWARHRWTIPSTPLADAPKRLADVGVALIDLKSYSPALAKLVALRALFGRRTVAQTLCKLIDPLQCETHLVGVFHAPYLPSTHAALEALGRKAICVQALGGLPEASPGKILRALPHNLDLRSLEPGEDGENQNQNALEGREPGLARAAADCALMLHAARGEDPIAAFSRAKNTLISGAARSVAGRL
jgi:anthranilate phosphoribosyltransferase